MEASLSKSFIFTICGTIMIIVGSNLVVENASNLAKVIGVSERMISLTIVSLGIMKLIENIKFNFVTLIISIIIYTFMYFIYAYLYMNNDEKGYVKKVFNKVLRRKT